MRAHKSAEISPRYYIPIFIILFALIFVRYCYNGFEYYAQAADVDLYRTGIKSATHDIFLAPTPFAKIFDMILWSQIWKNGIYAVGVVSAIYTLAAICLHRVFSSRLGTGYLFFVIATLSPVCFLGSYAIASASRSILGLMFASLSLMYFDKWCRHGGKPYMWLYVGFQFVAFGFGIQIAVLSSALTIVIMLLESPVYSYRKYMGFMFLGCSSVYIILHLITFGKPNFLFPWQSGWKKELLAPLLPQLRNAFFGDISLMDLFHGFGKILSDFNIIYLTTICFLCTLYFIYAHRNERDSASPMAEICSGLFLAVAPILPYLVISAPFRTESAVLSFIGIGLVSDAVLDLVCASSKSGKLIEAITEAVIALLCCIANVSVLCGIA